MYTGLEAEIEPPLVRDEFFDNTDRESEILRYIAGAMCHKFKLDSKVSNQQSSWIGLKGLGKLKEPSDELFETVKQFNDLFDLFQGVVLRRGFDPIEKCKLFIQSEFPYFNSKGNLFFCRVKFFAKIGIMNKELRLKKYGAQNVRFYKQTAQFLN